MATGDNLLTAVHTARACNMVSKLDDVIIVQAKPKHPGNSSGFAVTYQLADHCSNISDLQGVLEEGKLLRSKYHFACDGASFEQIRLHDRSLLYKVVQRGAVFARMLPEHKARLVEDLQELGYIVGMCGDGANDCGALKAANTGVSLSAAEASVASPFTSNQAHVQCVSTLIREGRCALVSSFALFKHLLATSWVLCVGVLILYSISCDLFDTQYIFIDGPLIIYPSLFFANLRPYHRLARRGPPCFLASFTAIFSLTCFILTQTTFFLCSWLFLRSQPWFTAWRYNSEDFSSYENTVIFTMMCYSMTFSSVVFCRGPPYRKPIYTNLVFLISMVVLLGVVSLVAVFPPEFIVYIFGMKLAPTYKFHLIVCGLCVMDFFVCILLEDFIINRVLHTRLLPWVRKKRAPTLQYEKVEYDLVQDPNWPPLDTLPKHRNSATKSPYSFNNTLLGIL